MAKVLGIGGIFMKSSDPKRLEAWYRDNLGIEIQSWGGAMLTNTEGSVGVWTPFAADTKYFEPSKREFMINLRVDDVQGLLTKLRANGVEVLDRGEASPELGEFRYVVDPDGTLLELWQPARDPEPAPIV